MATWHPPIPAGKLYSEDAIKLGSALAMLVWCYDGVQRGGTLEVSIEKAAQELNTPYRTVKEWWRLLRQGPFFSKQVDRGKRGWVVTMADEWLDWHVMNNNYPPVQGQEKDVVEQSHADTRSKPGIGQEMALKGEDTARQSPVKARSKPGIGQEMALKGSAYKVDHIDHKTGESSAKKTHEKSREPRTQASLDFLHEGVVIWKRVTSKKYISPVSATLIAKTVTDYAYWEKCVSGWVLAGNKPDNVQGMVDWYEHPGRMEQRQNGNGRRPDPVDNRPALEPFKPPVSKPSFAEVAKRYKEQIKEQIDDHQGH